MLVEIKPIITILEYNIDLSCIGHTAFEKSKKINKEINIKTDMHAILTMLNMEYYNLRLYLLNLIILCLYTI